ncbi:MAG: DUF3108 domain-containing protein [Bacteroidota bacterium]
MKKVMWMVLVLVMPAIMVKAQMREVTNTVFQRGEILTYRVYYESLLTGKVTAGILTMEVTKDNKVINERNTFHITAVGKTKGAFNFFFKVLDRYETYMDEKSLVPWLFIRRVDEGSYIINQDVTFNQNKNVAYFKDNKRKRSSTVVTPPNIQDILSAIYYMRSYDFANINTNDELPVKFMLDDTVFSSKVTYLGKSSIDIGIGKVKCIKLKPQVITGSVFKDPYPVIVYASDDKNRIPIYAEGEVLVGKVKMELVNWSGLKNSFSALE